MQTVTFDISKDAFGFMQAQGFSKPSDYFTMRLADDMLVAKKEDEELERLHDLLDEGDRSGYVRMGTADLKMRFAAIREKYSSASN